ncbi:tRNA (guanosine(46)-N7)-methyltransferase TrmB [Bacillus alkalicellulosilyticus]|uniref:tRNA (guanosine(46)-N7)-methyltransferase TrmB n=1 Tax=Alkalihalobacterium alkalicellulosilyticum TaxID=1912214 RepID=UPI00099617FE|nr:tRNA (guanosine(46)-N7)-methyltransferase TrmB [Bacillus alkalicellulosilyticus]
MRLRNKPWAKDEIRNNPSIVIPDPKEGKGKWKELFGNENPIHVEVGTGKGQFITKMAEQNPDINYIGVERYDSVILTALERISQSKRNNVKLLNEDVTELLSFFENNEVSRVYINFTDPWPKKRHEKRRLTYKDFLEKYQSIMKEKGEVHLKTDNQALFEYSLHSFSLYGMVLQNVSLNLHQSDFEGNVMTEYEEKFSQKGMPIYRCEAVYR